MRKIFLVFTLFGFVPLSNAMIKESLIVHNSRREAISVAVYNARGESQGTFTVGAQSTKYISIRDTVDGTDWFDAYDAQGTWIKRGSAAGTYTNFDWYVD